MYVKKQSMVGLKPVSLQHLAPKFVLPVNIAMLQIYVMMVSLNLIMLSIHAKYSVICAVISDCSTVTGLASCKELTAGLPLTCQSTITCLSTTPCSDEEYCTETDTCVTAGMLKISVIKSDLLHSLLHNKC